MKAKNKSFEKHPTGPVTLVCTRIIDKGSKFNPKKNKVERKLAFMFESNKLVEQEGEYQGKPHALWNTFNYSMFVNSNLCKFIESWRGQKFKNQDEADDFDIETLLKQPLFANIVHNESYVNIDSPMPVPDGMTAPTPVGDIILIDLEDLDMNEYNKLSGTMQAQLGESQEYQHKYAGGGGVVDGRNPPTAPDPTADGFDDDIPF